MNINWLVIPVMAGALLLFEVGRISVKRCVVSKWKLALFMLYLILGVPGFLFPFYYFHLFDDSLWFYEFRSLPFIELTAMGAGLFAGALAGLPKDPKPVYRILLMVILILGLIAPHLKPVLAPIPRDQFSDNWKDGVCLQSTASSCGPASAATIFKSLGESLSEQEIARECFSCLSGTENWYITRAFRRRGYTVTYRIEEGVPKNLRTPAIAGVRIGNVGHFITILENTNSVFVTGDPLSGREIIDVDNMETRFDFTGFFMEIGEK